MVPQPAWCMSDLRPSRLGPASPPGCGRGSRTSWSTAATPANLATSHEARGASPLAMWGTEGSVPYGRCAMVDPLGQHSVADRGDDAAPPPSLGSADFEILYRTYGPQVFRYAARRLGPGPAEDICAQTFTEAWASKERFNPAIASAGAWLLGIASNLLKRHHRAEQRQLRAFARTKVSVAEGDQYDAAVDRLLAAGRFPAVARALLELRAEDRELFWLSVTTDLTHAELAAVSEIAVGTVKSRLARTKARLRSTALADEPGLTSSIRAPGAGSAGFEPIVIARCVLPVDARGEV
jgi:RNA polymerase sigma factor (sigma-70 family)